MIITVMNLKIIFILTIMGTIMIVMTTSILR